MNIPLYPDFTSAINEVKLHLRTHGNHLETESWQGMKKPPEFFEVLNTSFSVIMPQYGLEAQQQIKPNLPWADDHFLERVGGKPLNPGKEYKNWPYYKNNPKNDRSRVLDGKFSHTYMERFWPKYAGEAWEETVSLSKSEELYGNRLGVRFTYADLNILMENIKKEPFTRQGFLPIWFPEDGTAVALGHRVPCTLGYHFIRRGNNLHVNYYIRSCDFFRHFRDDIYLTYLLTAYILNGGRYLWVHYPCI